MATTDRLERLEGWNRFGEAYRQLEECNRQRSSFFDRNEEGLYCHPLYRARWQETQAAYRARFPRRKASLEARETHSAWKQIRTAAEKGEFPELQAIETAYSAMARELCERVMTASDDCKRDLATIAARLEVPKGSSWIPIGSSSESEYRSQGYGAEKYAKAAAESIADKARACGLEVRILQVEAHRYTERHWRTGANMGERISYRFEVEALATTLGAQILEYKPQIPLREAVRLAWARGTNPRVAMPFLPYEFESENGLDHFGGYVARGDAHLGENTPSY